jgi:hypothetical protein
MPIYLRLTIDGDRTEFSKRGRAIVTKREETRQLNSFLETMREQIYEAQRELLNKGKEVTIKGSIEFKNRNISAVLAKIGQPYVQGYLPAYNYQAQVIRAASSQAIRNTERAVD